MPVMHVHAIVIASTLLCAVQMFFGTVTFHLTDARQWAMAVFFNILATSAAVGTLLIPDSFCKMQTLYLLFLLVKASFSAVPEG